MECVGIQKPYIPPAAPRDPPAAGVDFASQSTPVRSATDTQPGWISSIMTFYLKSEKARTRRRDAHCEHATGNMRASRSHLNLSAMAVTLVGLACASFFFSSVGADPGRSSQCQFQGIAQCPLAIGCPLASGCASLVDGWPFPRDAEVWRSPNKTLVDATVLLPGVLDDPGASLQVPVLSAGACEKLGRAWFLRFSLFLGGVDRRDHLRGQAGQPVLPAVRVSPTGANHMGSRREHLASRGLRRHWRQPTRRSHECRGRFGVCWLVAGALSPRSPRRTNAHFPAGTPN
jgi:hypothetical protein